MINAFLLMFEPMKTWERIAQLRRSVAFVLFTYLIPLLALVSAAEGYALVNWGKWGNWGGFTYKPRHFTAGEVIFYGALQCAVVLVIVFVAAKVMQSMGTTFHTRHTFSQVFACIAYSLGPMILLRFLDLFPKLSPWVPYAVGVLFTIAVLYHGVPRMLDPDPAHAFGLYVSSILLLVLTTGVARFVTKRYLEGQLGPLHTLFTS